MKKLMFWIALIVGVSCVVGGTYCENRLVIFGGHPWPAIETDGRRETVIFGVVILGCIVLYKFFPRNNWFSLYYKTKVLEQKQRVLELEAKIKDLEAKIEEK